MANTFLLDPFSGVSGNMFIGALIHLGFPLENLESELKKLPVDGYELICRTEQRRGVTGTYFNTVDLHQLAQKDNDKHEHHHHHQHYKDIKKMIEGSALSDKVKKDSLGIFRILAEAEAKIHDKPVEEIAFHEVGAVDSIVDICGAAIAIEYFNPDAIFSKPVDIGSGFVECAHGTFPIPAPATLEIMEGIPTFSQGDFETTTPTGAAILKYYVDEYVQPPLTIEKTAYGVGSKDPLKVPNVFRIISCTTETELDFPPQEETKMPTECDHFFHEELTLLETNIDDMNPQLYAPIMESCFQEGALDVFLTNVMMKKNRPGTLLSVLCEEETKDKILNILFERSSTLGIRETSITRHSLKRKIDEVQTPFGIVRVKSAFLPHGMKKLHPEYDDCLKLARENDIPVKVVMEEAIKSHPAQKSTIIVELDEKPDETEENGSSA